jgi:hypothetical protein
MGVHIYPTLDHQARDLESSRYAGSGKPPLYRAKKHGILIHIETDEGGNP